MEVEKEKEKEKETTYKFLCEYVQWCLKNFLRKRFAYIKDFPMLSNLRTYRLDSCMDLG